MALGVNVAARGEYSAELVASTGAKVARYVGHRKGQRDYALSLLQYGITPLVIMGSEPESLGQDPAKWAENARALVKHYDGLPVIWQAGNEPDAGWLPNNLGSWMLDERRAEHVSSWILGWKQTDELITVCRAAVGGGVMIGPGLCSGHAGWLKGIATLDMLDGIAIHPYAKEPATPELDGMLSSYAAYGKPLYATEFHSRTRGLAAYLLGHVSMATTFCLSDGMVPGFGMLEDAAALADFKAATGVIDAPVTPPEVVVAPSPDPTPTPPENAPVWLTAADGRSVGPGVSRYILDNGLFPLQGEEYCAMDVSVTACAEGMVWWFARAQMCKLVRWSES